MKRKLYIFLLVCTILLKLRGFVTIDYQVIILVSLILMIDILNTPNYENLEHLTNNEALQLIASLYNDGNMIVKNLTVSGDTNITGNLTTKGISTLGKVSIRDNKVGVSGSSDIDFGADKWVRAFNYGTGDYSTNAGFSSTNMYATTNLTIAGTNVTEPSLKILNKKKNNVAGYFSIKAYGMKTPLYYGWNMMWPDHNRSVNLVNRTVKTQAYISYSGGQNMVNAKDGNQDWTPRYLIVYPGYIAKLYYWDIAPASSDVYPEGEYKWDAGSPRNLRVHFIYVSLAEEGPYSDTRTPGQLSN